MMLSLAATVITAVLLVAPSDAWCRNAGWDISNLRVVSAGDALDGVEGLLLQGVVLEAEAYGENPAVPIQAGLLTLSFDLFQPHSDMPGQLAGRWYMMGDWRLEDLSAPEEVRNVRHNPAAISGRLMADFDESPMYAPSVTVLLRASAIDSNGKGIGTGTLELEEFSSGDMTFKMMQGLAKGGAK